MTHATSTATLTRATTTTATPVLSTEQIDTLVRDHLPLIGHLVREILSRAPGGIDRTALTATGTAALTAAARGFDPERGASFGKVAMVRIRTALVEVVSTGAAAGGQSLAAALGRTPTTEEIAAATGLSPREVDAETDDPTRAIVLSEPREHTERIGHLSAAIDGLPGQLRTVIAGQFLDERPLAEIATELGVSESRAVELRREALALIHNRLNLPSPLGQVA